MDIPGYKVERLIAKGGMAAVYLAVQESLGRHVALKVLQKFDIPAQSERFINEGRIIASLTHPNVITIHDIGVIDGQYYISMEYLEGGDLEARIRAGITPASAIALLKTLGACLAFVHSKGVVHRDIKPANILFRNDGTPVISDFGIAKNLDQDTQLTRDGTAMGSPDYLSPEQAECKPLDGRTDIYGLGIVFYEMLTGRKPFHGDSYIETVMAHITEPIPAFPQALAGYQALLDRMIAKDREGRFGSATELVCFIEQLQASGTDAQHASRHPPQSTPTLVMTDVDLGPAPRVRFWGKFRHSAAPTLSSFGRRFGMVFEPFRSILRFAHGRWVYAATGGIGVLVVAAVITYQVSPRSPHSNSAPVDQRQLEAQMLVTSRVASQPALEQPKPSKTSSSQDAGAPDSRLSSTIRQPAKSLSPKTDNRQQVLSTRSTNSNSVPVEEGQLADHELVTSRIPSQGAFEEATPSMSSSDQEAGAPESALSSSLAQPAQSLPPKMENGQQVAAPTPADPARQQRLEALLAQARQGLQEYRLTTPVENNAHYYYLEAQKLDNDNQEVVRGFQEIATRYLWLAEAQVEEHNYEVARRYVDRGLSVRPDHPGLVSLKDRFESGEFNEPHSQSGWREKTNEWSKKARRQWSKFWADVKQ